MFDNKIPFLSRVGMFISALGYAFHNGGVKIAWCYIKNSIRISYFRFKFKHSKKFRDKILSNVTADNIAFLSLIDMFDNNEEFGVRKYVKYLNDVEKEKYIKRTLEARDSMIKGGIDKEIVARVDRMAGLDLLGVEIKEEEVKPKKTYKKRVKKEKINPISTTKS